MNTRSTIRTRPATIDDKDFIISLVPRLTIFGPPSHRDADSMIILDTKILTGILIDPHSEHEIFIAEDENNIQIGFLHLQPGNDYYNKDKHGHISDVIVAPGAEGQGVGKSLMNKAEEWARLNGFQWLTLSVFAQNLRARELYNKLGYSEDIMKYVKKLE
jgi:ribosomal protein S18 acetylase RimI-like enzyme